MWLERYNIVITSFNKDFLPSNWVSYRPTVIDIGVFARDNWIIWSGSIAFHAISSNDGHK
jgi:5,10-methylene-tetrahydrofolate dehydrogenase/methenyl tetrahydrofolate cyclohydrolase